MSRLGVGARAALVPLIVLSVSCARTERTEQTDSTHVAIPGATWDSLDGPASAPDAPQGAEGTSTESARDTVDTLSAPTSATLAEARARLQTETRRLERAVRARDMAGATAASLRVRDAAVALTGKTAELPAASSEQIETAVTELTSLAEKLRADAAARSIEALDEDAGGITRIVGRLIALSAPGR